jgi:hypothetical protein
VAIECIDRALRIVAPVDDVTAWIVHVSVKPGWMDKNSPTRRAKVMFAMRHRSNRDARLAVSQVEALATLVQDVAGNLQSVKHGDAQLWLSCVAGSRPQREHCRNSCSTGEFAPWASDLNPSSIGLRTQLLLGASGEPSGCL